MKNTACLKGAPVKLTAFFASLLICGVAAARDVGQIPPDADSKTLMWFRMSKSPSGTSCCDEADGYREGVAVKIPHGEPTVIFRSWWAASDGYRLSVVDPTDLSSAELFWDGPVVRDNPTGGASGLAIARERHFVGALLLTRSAKLESVSRAPRKADIP